MNAALIEATLDRLSRVFHSEADFQQALARGLRRHFPSLEIRAEYQARDYTVDLWLADENSTAAVELKYPKKPFEARTESETFAFGDDATDIACYGYLEDITRLEELVDHGICDWGAAVVLSNDSLLWDNRPNGANYDEFKLSDGRTVSGTVAWPEGASLRTSQRRTLEVTREHTFDWREYSYRHPDRADGNTAFKYCISVVERA